ncbi:MAG TPA: poly-beta-1,6-N-acetyl-D-glucosamine biosynthesis protein PgaD [Xanthomonadaceae bacterium]
MAQRLIINARSDLSWRRRLLSDVVTALMWGGWILLWLPVFRKLLQVIELHMSFTPAAIQVLDTLTPIPLAHSLIALLGTSALLMLWTLLPTRKLTHAHGVQTLEDYAEYFDLPEHDIVAGQDSRICVVHHDEHGNIVGIDARE